MTTASEQIDRELAIAALQKRKAGQQPTARELAALKRIDKGKEEQQRWEFYRTIPQKHWREMGGGWQAKILQEQADRYGLPIGRAIIDLPAVVLALRKFLAANAHRLSKESDDPLLCGPSSPALERYREARAGLANLELHQRQGNLLDRAEVHERMLRAATPLRRAGEALQRKFGVEAQRVLDAAVDEFLREVGVLGSGDSNGETEKPD